MKAVQTFWIKKEDDSYGGWPSIRDQCISWSLSYFLLARQFKTVELVCNSEGRDLLINKLELGYNIIKQDLDNIQDQIDTSWILAKTYAYSIQKKPFIHVDGDAFLFDPITKTVLASDIFIQNMEIDHPMYSELQAACQHHNCQMPSFISQSNRVIAANLGIVGGQNLSFFTEFHEIAKQFALANKNIFKQNPEQFPFISTYIEQGLFFAYAKSNGQKIYTFQRPSFRYNYDHVTNFDEQNTETHEPRFVHLLANFKEKKGHTKKMSDWLKKLWPEQWNKIETLF